MNQRWGMRSLEERFFEKVDKTPTCWLWMASKHKSGYGRFRENMGKWMSYAHRVSWELSRGPIPPGMMLDHLCRVRACVNPDHLEIVTHAENNLRGTSPWAINAKRKECVNGHAFDEQNTIIDRNGNRICRACKNALARRRYWTDAAYRALKCGVKT